MDDDTEDGSIAGCWWEPTIPIPQIAPELWRLARPLFRTARCAPAVLTHNPPSAEAVPPCVCGSQEWRIIEHLVTEFRPESGTVRPVATTHRDFSCARCNRPLEDGGAIERSYLSVCPEEALIKAAMEVVKTWEHGDLAGSVRRLGAVLEGMGYGMQQ